MSFYLGSKFAALLDSPQTGGTAVNNFITANPGAVKAFLDYILETRALDLMLQRPNLPWYLQTANSLLTGILADLNFTENVLKLGKVNRLIGVDSFIQDLWADETKRGLLSKYPSEAAATLNSAAARAYIYNSDTVLTSINNDSALYDAFLSSPQVSDYSMLIVTASVTTSYTPFNTNSPLVMLAHWVSANTNIRWQSGRRADSTMGENWNTLSPLTTAVTKNIVPITGTSVTVVSSTASRTLNTKAFMV